MTHTKKPAVIVALFALLFASCDWDSAGSGNYKWVNYDLRGTWERDVPGFWPEGQTVTTQKGKLLLSADTIIITGPVEHLQGFTRTVALEAYTEDGGLYIKDKGVWQSPIPYTRWHSAGYPWDEMLTLGSGATAETLKLIGD
ncbi:hypothetical protein AGMMS49587_05500 [Spirochaetia bacterium]|nr:hypothetical protein AGMMS49587_05500 [Spirochaetia bacterium]